MTNTSDLFATDAAKNADKRRLYCTLFGGESIPLKM